MYSILIYDIKSDEDGARVSRNVFKVAKKYLVHIQNSVFEGDLSDVQYRKLKYELKENLRPQKDSCILFYTRSEKWMEKEFFVEEEDKTSKFI